MACIAQGDEVFFHIASQQAALLHVMNFKILSASASLAPPPVAREHLAAKLLIGIRLQAKPRMFWKGRAHDALGIRSKNSCRCEFGSST